MADGDDRARCCAGMSRWAPTRRSAATPQDRFAPPPPAPHRSPAPATAIGAAIVAPRRRRSPPTARRRRARRARARRAAAANTLAELAPRSRAFEGCALKRTATNTVFADGVAGAPLMVIGEAPGADEDRLGLPFVGRSGQLLDRMLAAIGFDRRRNAYITNILFWRPPGNRKPTDEEIARACPSSGATSRSARPRVVMLCGGTATAALLGRPKASPGCAAAGSSSPCRASTDRCRRSRPITRPSCCARPQRKGEAWRDLLALQSKLEVASNNS